MRKNLRERIRGAQAFLIGRAKSRDERGNYSDANEDRKLAEWFELCVELSSLPGGLGDKLLEELRCKVSNCESDMVNGVT
jgi:hypothetical protein